MKILGICFVFLGAFSIYSSHHNQNLFAKPLPPLFKWLGMSALMISLVLLIISLPKLVACLIWVMLLITVWSFAPFLSLFKRK
ncbi:hypothetical protein [Acinetobacter piscicola]|uniref:hypothetical protein n=1 Tax=Acinetobacter piscicola TaxID=2006115 RepID=UPI00101FB9DF|nr:hypothetical protein [Acinetobacter piscicola]RYL28622.1 hypothetical protein EWP19_04605 [Acinetobacter piscicola]